MSLMPTKVTAERFTRLKVQENLLIKSCQSSLEAIRLCNPNLVTEYESLRKDFTTEREKGSTFLSQQLNDIFHHIANFREEANRTDFNAEIRKEKQAPIEKKIGNLKEIIEKEKYKLNEAQKLLAVEVQSIQNRLDSQSEENSKIIAVKSKAAKVVSAHRHITHPDIIRFEKFRDENGDTGNWDEADHVLFLQVRHRHIHKGFDIFATILQSQMPEITVDNIEEHEHWFQQYKTFKAKYKTAIETWKKSKENSKSKNEAAESNSNNNKYKKPTTSESSIKDVKRKELLSEWKKQRQARLDAINQSIRIQREKEEEKQKIEKEKQGELRRLVLEYKQKKKMKVEEAKELQKLRAQEEKKEKAAQANKLLKVYRKLDTLYVERQKVLRQHSPPIREMPRAPPAVSVERDPNRVLRHTRVWQAHCLTKSTHIKPLLHVRNLPHLAVPDWRKGVL